MAYKCTNRLLSAITEESRTYLLDRSHPLPLEQKTVLYEAEEPPAHIYFLESGFASVVATMRNGETAEVEMIGREGIVGGYSLLGHASIAVPTRCFMQISGHGFRISIGEMRKAFQTMPDVREQVSEFIQSEMATLSLIAGCHRVHEAEKRLVRWLLMAQDRVGTDVLKLTQEFLAEMLGTRRTTVTEVAGALQRLGYIEYHRGTVHILNRAGLESAACDCYGIVRRIYQGLYTS